MSSLPRAGLRALAIAVPEQVLTNDMIRERYPELVAKHEAGTLSRIMNNTATTPDMAHIDRSIVPFLKDPFRGVVRRRVLGPEGSSIELEVRAGREALRASGLTPGDVDLLISVGFPTQEVGIGNAVHVAKALELTGGAFNLETACAGPLTALQTASALVRAGEYARVLVTVSCAYSRFAQPEDSLSWFLGDGAGALIVEPVPEGEGILAAYTMHTADTCGSWYYQLEVDETGKPIRTMRAHPETGQILRGTVEKHLKRACHGALERAEMTLDDIDCFVFHTPTAWFRDFCTQALGVDPSKTVEVYDDYANVGPALTPINLFHAAQSGRLKKGDNVLVYGPGSVSSAAAMIMRWGEVSLGALPPGISPEIRP